MTGPSRRLEFWPDYGGVLLHEGGRALPLEELALPFDLVSRAQTWVARYEDARLEPDTRDPAWSSEGSVLFRELRDALRRIGIELVDWEGTWNVEGRD